MQKVWRLKAELLKVRKFARESASNAELKTKVSGLIIVRVGNCARRR
jgi:hypothetical protein